MISSFVYESGFLRGTSDPLGNLAAAVFVVTVIVQDLLHNSGSASLRLKGRTLASLSVPMFVCALGIIWLRAVGA